MYIHTGCIALVARPTLHERAKGRFPRSGGLSLVNPGAFVTLFLVHGSIHARIMVHPRTSLRQRATEAGKDHQCQRFNEYHLGSKTRGYN